MTHHKLRSVCLAFRDGLLAGKSSEWMCAAVSWPLAGFLDALGVETEAVEVDLGHCNHTFLRMKDGTIIDATCDQFNYAGPKYPKVHVGPPLDIHLPADPRNMGAK